MSHFAKIENNIVTNVLVIGNECCDSLEFPESEPVGQEFLKSKGFEGRWIQTSYNGNFRYRYATIGGIYYEEDDVFLLPRPYPSWNLDKENYTWQAPKPVPDDRSWAWNEEHQVWEDPIDPT